MFGFGMHSVFIVLDVCTYYAKNSLEQNNDTREYPTKE